jgi:hypothetical protein
MTTYISGKEGLESALETLSSLHDRLLFLAEYVEDDRDREGLLGAAESTYEALRLIFVILNPPK